MIPYLAQAGYALFLALLLKATHPAYLAFRKRRSGYGTIFNSVTGLPEALVSVRLRDLHGQTIRSTVSDKHGRYRLLAPKGEYIVELTKAGCTFPSVYIGSHSASAVYDNLLPATHIIVKDHGVITKNIPIDPEQAGRSSIFRSGFRLSKKNQVRLALISPFLAFGLAYLQHPSWIAWGLFVLYIVILFNRLFSYKPADPPFGTITDTIGKPLAQVVVRIFDGAYNKLLETQVTSEKGRYAFIVKKGAYYVLVKKDGYKSVRLNFPHIMRDGFLLVKDVKMKASTTKEIDPLEEKYGNA